MILISAFLFWEGIYKKSQWRESRKYANRHLIMRCVWDNLVAQFGYERLGKFCLKFLNAGECGKIYCGF